MLPSIPPIRVCKTVVVGKLLWQWDCHCVVFFAWTRNVTVWDSNKHVCVTFGACVGLLRLCDTLRHLERHPKPKGRHGRGFTANMSARWKKTIWSWPWNWRRGACQKFLTNRGLCLEDKKEFLGSGIVSYCKTAGTWNLKMRLSYSQRLGVEHVPHIFSYI